MCSWSWPGRQNTAWRFIGSYAIRVAVMTLTVLAGDRPGMEFYNPLSIAPAARPTNPIDALLTTSRPPPATVSDNEGVRKDTAESSCSMLGLDFLPCSCAIKSLSQFRLSMLKVWQASQVLPS